jgi:hypothetical protein
VQTVADTQKGQLAQITELTAISNNNSAGIKNLLEVAHETRDASIQQWEKLNKWVERTEVHVAKEGRFTPGQLFTVLWPMALFIAALAALWIAPLQLQVASLKEELHGYAVAVPPATAIQLAALAETVKELSHDYHAQHEVDLKQSATLVAQVMVLEKTADVRLAEVDRERLAMTQRLDTITQGEIRVGRQRSNP